MKLKRTDWYTDEEIAFQEFEEMTRGDIVTRWQVVTAPDMSSTDTWFQVVFSVQETTTM